MVIQFPAKKTLVAQTHCAISHIEKTAFSTPRRVALGLPSPSPRVCTGGRTLTSQQKFLASIGYQIPLPREIRSKLLQLLSPFRFYFLLLFEYFTTYLVFCKKKCLCKRRNICNPSHANIIYLPSFL